MQPSRPPSTGGAEIFLPLEQERGTKPITAAYTRACQALFIPVLHVWPQLVFVRDASDTSLECSSPFD